MHPRIRCAVAVGLSLTCLLPGCDARRTRGTPATLDELHEEALHLEGTTLVQADWLASPAALKVVGKHLYIGEAYSAPFVHRVDLDDVSAIESWGPQGEGPGEFQTVASFAVSPDGEVWAYDTNTRRLTNVEHPMAGADVRVITFRGERTLEDPSWLNDSTIVTQVLDFEDRLALFDLAGQEMGRLGTQPRTEGVREAVRPYFNQASMTVNRERGLVALASRWSSRVHIIHFDGSSELSTSGPVEFVAEFQFVSRDGRPILGVVDDTRLGYASIASTGSRVYALFSGRRNGDFGGSFGFGRYVHVFDWEGAFLGILRLDEAVASIAVDANTRRLYAGRWEPVPAIRVYPLPEGVPWVAEDGTARAIISGPNRAGEAGF